MSHGCEALLISASVLPHARYAKSVAAVPNMRILRAWVASLEKFFKPLTEVS
jgi:hypothetical protein